MSATEEFRELRPFAASTASSMPRTSEGHAKPLLVSPGPRTTSSEPHSKNSKA